MKRKRAGKIKRTAGLIVRIILWVLAFALAALPAVFMNTVYGYFPVVFLAAVVLASGVSMRIIRKDLLIVKEDRNLTCERNQSLDLGIKIQNRSKLICTEAYASFSISDLFGEEDEKRLIPFSIGAKEILDFELGMQMNHIGVYTVGLESIKVRDFLGVMSCRAKQKGSFSAVVTPIVKDLQDIDIIEDAYTETDKDTRATVVGGMDYTGVREYVPGDPMKQIHWKLSAHTKDYLTKLQENNQQQDFTVIMDFASKPEFKGETAMDLNDTLIETTLSILNELYKRDLPTRLVYCTKDRNVTHISQVTSGKFIENIPDFAMITTRPGSRFETGAAIIEGQLTRRNNVGNVIVITTDPSFELQQQLIALKRKEHGTAIYTIVPAGYTSRDMERIQAEMSSLTDADIPCVMVSTAVNAGGAAS